MVIFRSNFKSFRQSTLGYEFVPMVKSWVRIRPDHDVSGTNSYWSWCIGYDLYWRFGYEFVGIRTDAMHRLRIRTDGDDLGTNSYRRWDLGYEFVLSIKMPIQINNRQHDSLSVRIRTFIIASSKISKSDKVSSQVGFLFLAKCFFSQITSRKPVSVSIFLTNYTFLCQLWTHRSPSILRFMQWLA